MEIRITDIEFVKEEDKKLLFESVWRVQQLWGDSKISYVAICCASRHNDGWLEYLAYLRDRKTDKNMLTLECIQRTLDSECEFHT